MMNDVAGFVARCASSEGRTPEVSRVTTVPGSSKLENENMLLWTSREVYPN